MFLTSPCYLIPFNFMNPGAANLIWDQAEIIILFISIWDIQRKKKKCMFCQELKKALCKNTDIIIYFKNWTLLVWNTNHMELV